MVLPIAQQALSSALLTQSALTDGQVLGLQQAAAAGLAATASSYSMADPQARPLDPVQSGATLGVLLSPQTLSRGPQPLYRRILIGAAAILVGAALLVGCTFDRHGLGRFDAGDDAAIAVDAGIDAGPDAAIIDAGIDPTLTPVPQRPSDGLVLPPTRAFLSWQDGVIPGGLTVTGYDLCSTTGALALIDGEAECPNPRTPTNRYDVLDPLSADSSYLWKVRSRFSDGSTSLYSAVRVFSTDHSVVGWWRFDEGAGTTANDSSGVGNHGTLVNGPVWTTGVNGTGSAVRLDGTNDYVEVSGASGLDLSGPLSVLAWANPSVIPSSPDTGILNMGLLNYALTYHTNGRAYFYLGDGGNSLSAAVAPGLWHQLVGTFNGTTNAGGMNLYLDGSLAGTRASLFSTTGATGNLEFGRYSTSHFPGWIDEVIVFGGELTSDAVVNDNCAKNANGGVDPLPASCD